MKVGDHLVSPRSGYTHHGIYIGDGKVIHYSGFTNGISKGVISITSVKEFAQGNDVRIKQHFIRIYGPEKSVERAKSRLGEDWYNVLLNNCEHFVTWCIVGLHSSSQINSAITMGADIANTLSKQHTVLNTVTNPVSVNVIKSIVSSSTGVATGASIASSTGVTTALVAGVTATSAAPVVAAIVVGAGVGYGVKKLLDWIWD